MVATKKKEYSHSQSYSSVYAWAHKYWLFFQVGDEVVVHHRFNHSLIFCGKMRKLAKLSIWKKHCGSLCYCITIFDLDCTMLPNSAETTHPNNENRKNYSLAKATETTRIRKVRTAPSPSSQAKTKSSTKKQNKSTRLFAPTASSRARTQSSRLIIETRAANHTHTTTPRKSGKRNKKIRSKPGKQNNSTALRKNKTTCTLHNTERNKPCPTSPATATATATASSLSSLAPPPPAPAPSPHSFTAAAAVPMATPRSKMYPKTTPKRGLSQRARRPTPQSRQAKHAALEREKNRLQAKSMYSQCYTGHKKRIVGHAKRLGSARRLGRATSTTTTDDSVKWVKRSKYKTALATPGNDRKEFGRVRFSPASGATMKINFNKNTCPPVVSTPQTRKQDMSAVSTVSIVSTKDGTTSTAAPGAPTTPSFVEGKSALSMSPLTIPSNHVGHTSSSSTTPHDQVDREVQQLLSTSIINSVRSPRGSAFSRLNPERSHSPITVSPTANIRTTTCNREKTAHSRETAVDPLGRTLKCQTDIQSKDAIRGFCSNNARERTIDDYLNEGDDMFQANDDEAVSWMKCVCFFMVFYCYC